MPIKKFGFGLYILAWLVIAFIVGEGIAKLKYQKSYLAANIHKDRTFHHLLPPHTEGPMFSEGDFNDSFITNNRGMRGPKDYVYEKPEGIQRIAVMGDSFTFGVGVKAEETYSALLQEKLNQSHPNTFEVMNFGVSSYSPLLHYIYLKREVLQYQLDTLILAFDLADLQDDYFYEKNAIHDKAGEIIACDPYSLYGKPNWWAYLKKHSVLMTILDEKLFQSFRKMKTIGFTQYIQNKIKKVRNKTEILANPTIDNIEFDRMMITRPDKDMKVLSKHWERSAKYIRMIHELCQKHNIRFLLVAYPYGHQVGDEQWAKGREYWAFKKDKTYDADRTFQLIRDFADTNNISLLSLLDPMRQNKDQVLYYNNDGHWTPAAHRVAANSIADAVKREVPK